MELINFFSEGTRQCSFPVEDLMQTAAYLCLILPAVRSVQWFFIFFPCYGCLRNTIYLTLEASNSSFIHRHGYWMSVELWKSCMNKYRNNKINWLAVSFNTFKIIQIFYFHSREIVEYLHAK